MLGEGEDKWFALVYENLPDLSALQIKFDMLNNKVNEYFTLTVTTLAKMTLPI
jgi:hypothetical protein